LGREFRSGIYELVFTTLRNLKQLRILACGLPKDIAFYGRLAKNPSIEDLILTDSMDHISVEVVNKFLNCLPNIKNLTILQPCGVKRLEACATQLEKLESLAVNEFNQSFSQVQFPKLNKIFIRWMDDNVAWDCFTEKHPQILFSVNNNDTTAFWNQEDYEHMLLDYRPVCLDNTLHDEVD
jgi:hypothetical protein